MSGYVTDEGLEILLSSLAGARGHGFSICLVRLGGRDYRRERGLFLMDHRLQLASCPQELVMSPKTTRDRLFCKDVSFRPIADGEIAADGYVVCVSSPGRVVAVYDFGTTRRAYGGGQFNLQWGDNPVLAIDGGTFDLGFDFGISGDEVDEGLVRALETYWEHAR
jgi:hypothetical protein